MAAVVARWMIEIQRRPPGWLLYLLVFVEAIVKSVVVELGDSRL